jgi:hypothetical protein
MSLAFALTAAINGSTGSSATLSFGLDGTKPRRRQPSGSEILIPQGWRRKPPETLSCESPCSRSRSGRAFRANAALAVDRWLVVRSGGLF